jgi:AcrR family transcriptional regulator
LEKRISHPLERPEFEQVFEHQVPPAAVNDRASATYDQRLNRILEAATELIAKVGYERASMRAVARITGASLAGLYHYVPNKERMLFLIQHRTFNALLNNLREKLLGVDDPAEQVRLMVRTHVDYFAANMAALKVCSHELDTLTGEAYEETFRIRREYYQLVRGMVERLLGERASELDPHLATMSLFGMLNWLYRWHDPKRRSSASVANQLAAQFLNSLRPATATTPPRSTSPTG